MGFVFTTRFILNEAKMKQEEVMFDSIQSLVKTLKLAMLGLKGSFISADGSAVDYDGMKQSLKFAEYSANAEQLKFVNLMDMDDSAKKSFLINIYNCMTIHALTEGLLDTFPGGTISRMKLYAKAAYNIGGIAYSLNDIENGLLRGNRLSAVPMTSVPFSAPDDPRRDIMLRECDPRIHFALNCGAKSCPPVAVYSDTTEELDRELNLATENFLGGNVVLNSSTHTIRTSMLLSWYRQDFGVSDAEVIQWILKHSPPSLAAQISDFLIACPVPTLVYDSYDWGLNSA